MKGEASAKPVALVGCLSALAGSAGCGASAGPQPQGDAALDTVVSDAGPTSAERDAGSTIEPPACHVDSTVLEVSIADQGARSWDAIQAGDVVHVVYEVPVSKESQTIGAERLDRVSFSSTGPFSKAAPVVNAADACNFSRNPALGLGAGGKPLLYYTSNIAGTNELYGEQLGSNGAAARLTIHAESVAEWQEHMVSARFGGQDLLAYVNVFGQLQGPSFGQIVTRPSGGSEQEVLPVSHRAQIKDLALAAFSGHAGLGGLLAWIDETPDHKGIYAQTLDQAGRATATPTLLSSAAGAYSNVVVELLPTGASQQLAGAIVYGMATNDLHTSLGFRTISHDGTFGEEVVLTSNAVDARGVGIAPFASGYALVYRVANASQPSIQVQIIDQEGNSAAYSQRLLVRAEPNGSAAKVFVTNDGRLSVVFSDTDGTSTVLRAVRAICDP